MGTADMAALKVNQIRALSTADVAALSSRQVAAFSTAQMHAFTTAQLAALRPEKAGALKDGQDDPILVDAPATPDVPDLQAAATGMASVLAQFDADGVRLPVMGAPLASTAESLARSVSQKDHFAFLVGDGKK